MARLGDRVIFTVQTRHRARTIKGGRELQGSMFHPEFERFAGLVSGDATPAPGEDRSRFHLTIFIPDRQPVSTIAAEGAGDGEFEVLEG